MNKTTLNCNRLIACRTKLGITKQEAAKRMNLSQPAYLRYESGERTPSIHVIFYMAHILGTSVEYLIGKTDNPSPTTYIVKKKETPDLFSIIELYNTSDFNTQDRLLSYLHNFSKSTLS